MREVLDPGDNAAFVRRVMARAEAALAEGSWWEVLGAWARPGLAAAAIVAGLVGVWAGSGLRSSGDIAVIAWEADEATIDDALAGDADVTEPSFLLASPGRPDVDVVLAVFQR